MSTRRASEALHTVSNVAVILFLGAFAFRPGGALHTRASAWLEARQHAAVVGSKWPELSVSRRIVSGSDSAGIRIGLVSDYECPFCADMVPIVDSVTALIPEVGFALLHNPIDEIHPEAERLARISICAERLDSFRELHHQLYHSEGTTDWTEDPAALGAGGRGCIEADSTSARLRSDAAFLDALEIRGTPAFVFPSGVVHTGTISVGDLERLVREAMN